jgi:hypothetical protein
MSRVARFRAALSVLLAGAVAAQALATCGIWVLLAATPAPCCPSHTRTSGASVSAVCCAPGQNDAPVPDSLAGTLPAPVVAVVAAFSVAPVPSSDRVGYAATLPVAVRGHTSVSLSSLLI